MREIEYAFEENDRYIVFFKQGFCGEIVTKSHESYDQIKAELEAHKELIRVKPPSDDKLDVLLRIIRSERDQLLSVCDWTQNADAPVDREAWKEYRQALRDVTKQSSFPTSIIWPKPPSK